MTPDHEPILGFIPGVEGFVTAAGGSGHGFMLAPAVGRLIAELILDGESSLDLTPLTIQRFLGKQFPLSAYSPVGA
jgi:sarcosine oxidase subunit beta